MRLTTHFIHTQKEKKFEALFLAFSLPPAYSWPGIQKRRKRRRQSEMELGKERGEEWKMVQKVTFWKRRTEIVFLLLPSDFFLSFFPFFFPCIQYLELHLKRPLFLIFPFSLSLSTSFLHTFRPRKLECILLHPRSRCNEKTLILIFALFFYCFLNEIERERERDVSKTKRNWER